MPKEIVTNGSYKQQDSWAEVGWARDQYVQVGVCREDEINAGLFMHLDRESINRLIRVLRRARDQAYGADA